MARTVQGMQLALRAFVAAGATRVWTAQAVKGLEYAADASFSPEQREERLEAFLKKVAAAGIEKFRDPVFSAHQMSSACMGTQPGKSACDTDGQVR